MISDLPANDADLGENVCQIHQISRYFSQFQRFLILPSKTSGAIHAALPLLFVMCVCISQAVPKSQILRTVPPRISNRLKNSNIHVEIHYAEKKITASPPDCD